MNSVMKKVSVLDYGVGNIFSVVRMIEKAGGIACRISTESEICSSQKIIIPGVGSFDHGMNLLHKKELVNALNYAVDRNILLLGICLGMQLLFNSSEEGTASGLGFITGKVVKFNNKTNKLRVPHMGWNEIDVIKKNSLISSQDRQGEKHRFYFVHSYHAICQNPDDVLATVCYGSNVTAIVNRGNIYGVQFHPEKSHRFGMELIKNFIEL